MVRRSLVCALSVACATPPAVAEEVSVSEPLAAASVHEGPLDLVAFYQVDPAGAYVVTATFADRSARSRQSRVTMALADGEGTRFAMPGFRGANYAFSRSGDALTVSAEPATRTASAD